MLCGIKDVAANGADELTRNKERWKEGITYVASLLTSDSVRIQAKALWMLGEMGLAFPDAVKSSVHAIAFFLNNDFQGLFGVHKILSIDACLV